MTILKFPEDSILKRHFDANVELKRQLWLQMPPSDSILRRHAMSLSSHQTYRASKTAGSVTSSASNRTSTAPVQQAAPKAQGFFARLFSLFAPKT